MLLRLIIAALRSPAGKRMTSWLSFVMFYFVFVTFPCGILGQVWYLIVSIPNLCKLSYSDINTHALLSRSTTDIYADMVVFPFPFPQFADWLGKSVQTWDLLLVLINLVDLNQQVTKDCRKNYF